MNTALYLVLSLPLSLFPAVVKHAKAVEQNEKLCFFR